jgi:hypothetical protein
LAPPIPLRPATIHVFRLDQPFISGYKRAGFYTPIRSLKAFRLFVFVIDAFLLFITDKLLEDFEIDNFFITLVAAVLLALLNGIWRWLLF